MGEHNIWAKDARGSRIPSNPDNRFAESLKKLWISWIPLKNQWNRYPTQKWYCFETLWAGHSH